MEWISENWMSAAGIASAVCALGLWAAIKYLPDLIFSWFEARVEAMFAAGDAADDELLLAHLTWADKKFKPRFDGDKRGPEKLEAFANKIAALMPMPIRIALQARSSKLKELCQRLYDRGMVSIAKLRQEHKAAAAKE